MRKIVMINGVSQGDALGGIGRSFEAPCNALGYEFVEINLAKLETVLGFQPRGAGTRNRIRFWLYGGSARTFPAPTQWPKAGISGR
jgi:hypothetical protein